MSKKSRNHPAVQERSFMRSTMIGALGRLICELVMKVIDGLVHGEAPA